MRNTILAKRYAKALFAVGSEENLLDEFAAGLNQLKEVFTEVPEVGDALTNPLYPLEARTKVMDHLIATLKFKASTLMGNFLHLLVQKKRAAIIPEVADAFQAMVDAERNICKGKVVSAIALSEPLQAKVQQALEKMTGKKVVLTSEVDSSIIGGIIAKVGDLVLDGSIKTQLTRLKESIKGE